MGDVVIAGYPPDEPYQRGDDESREEYEAFVEWCRTPRQGRSVPNFARITGFPAGWINRVRREKRWDDRVAHFDRACEALTPEPLDMTEGASRAAQLAASKILTELGSLAISLKNPAQLNVDQALKLMEKGTEMQRRALGEADVTIDVKQGSLENVRGMVDEVLTLEAEEVMEDVGEERNASGGEDVGAEGEGVAAPPAEHEADRGRGGASIDADPADVEGGDHDGAGDGGDPPDPA